MPIAVQCGSCDTRFRVPDSAAGGSVKCPKCSHRFNAPEAADAVHPTESDRSSRKARPSSSVKRPLLAEAVEDEGGGGNGPSARPTAPRAKRKTRTDDSPADESRDGSPKSSGAIVRLLMVLSCVATILVVCALGGLWVSGSLKPEQEKHKDLTREQLRKLVIGKTKQQVIEAIGKPAETQDQTGVELWNYYNVAVDPVTGKKSAMVQLVFQGGSVTTVNFY